MGRGLSAPDAPVFRRSLNDQRPNGAIAWDPDRPEVRYLEGSTVHTLRRRATGLITRATASRPGR